MSTYKLTPQERRARMQVLAAQRRATAQNRAKTGAYRTSKAVQPTASAVSTPKNDTNILLRLSATQADLASNVITGALKSFEGIFDFGAGIVGAVGGIFSEDFQEGVQNVIEYDAVGNWVGDPLDELFSDSLLEDSKTGQIIEAVASGVGQMLPAVAVTVATAGAMGHTMAAAGTQTAAQIAAAAAKAKQISQIASLATTAVGAAGNATEEAFKDGADYYQGLGYGAASGAVEAATEKLMGGPTKNLYGRGMLDGIFKSAAKESTKSAVKAGAKVGAKSVIKGMVEEGAEEALAEVVSPALKSIYKGRDAFSEYGEGEYWSGVGEAALVGGLTSAVYGGTLGKVKALGGQSAIERDAEAVREDIDRLTAEMHKLEEKGKLTPEKETQIKKTIKADIELLSKQLQKTSEKKRDTVLKDGLFSSFFAEDGTISPEANERLDAAIKAAGDTSSGLDRRYYSESARGREQEIIDGLAAQGTKVVEGELTADEAKAYAEVRKAHNKLRALGFVDTDLVLAESMPNDNAYLDGKTVVLGRDTLTNGNYIKSLVHETTHFTEGTKEWLDVTNYVFGKDGSSVTSLLERVKTSGYGVTQEDVDTVLKAVKEGKLADTEFTDKQRTLVSEVIAMKMEETFSDARSVERLVNDNPSLAKRIWQRIKALVDSFGKSKEEKEQIKKLRQTEELFRKALENAGAEYIAGEIEKSATEGTEVETQNTIKFSRMNNKSFSENVSDILSMSNEDAQRNAEEANFIRILQNTPNVILENVEDSANLEVIIRFDALYLAARESGVLKGHYHNLGDTIKKLPDFIAAPDAILRMNNGRLNLFANIPSPKGNNGIISIELNTVKDINSNYKKYNLVISAFSAKDSYTRNNIEKNGIKIEYQKEDLSQVNPQLYEWLAIVNDKSSTDSISQTEEKSTLSEQKNSSKIRESRKITADMSDKERAEILTELNIISTQDKLSYYNVLFKEIEKIPKLAKSKVEKKIKDLADELKILNIPLSTPSLNIKFELSKNNGLKESLSQQLKYGGNYHDLSRALINLHNILKNAILIEIHSKDRYKDTSRKDINFKAGYVLFSAFHTDEDIFPVKLEIKEKKDSQNVLYLLVSMTKIKRTGVMESTIDNDRTSTIPLSDTDSIYSLPQIVSKINPQDKHFLKYFPDQMLTELQRVAKYEALKSDQEKLENLRANDTQKDIKHSLKENSDYSLSSGDKASLNDELRQLAFYDDLDIREDTYDTPPIPDTPPRKKKAHTSKPTQTNSLTDKQIKKLISQQTNSIKYTKTEAKSVLYDILENDLSFGEHYGKLKGKSNQEIISMLWRGLSLTEPGKRFGTALDIAEYILANSVINNVQANNVLELYEAWKSVRSQSDVDNLKAFATELEKFDIEIKGETKEELISQIDAAFKGAREDAKKDAKQAFDSFLSTEERKAKKQEIAKKILYAFDEKGTPSKSGELIAKMEQEMLSAIQKYNEGREYNKTKNRLLYKLRDIENLKKGRFLNASQFKVDIFKNSIERLAKIAHQGNINESGTRDVLKGILSWYDVKENPILSEDHYNKEIRKSLQGIVSGEGELSLEELKDLENIVKFFYWFEKNYNKVWENGKRVDALPKAKKFLEIIKANSELKVGGLRKLFVDKYGRTFFDPMSLVRYMDRYEQGFYTEMLEQLREGALAAQEMEMEIREPLEEFYEKHKKFLKDIRNKTIKYQDSDIPITQAMLLYMTLNRKHALAGLASSGFTYFDGKKQIKLKGFLSNSTQEPDALTIEAKAKEIQAELSKQFSDSEMEYISIAENIFNVVCKDIKYDTDMNRQGYSNVLDDYYVPIVRATIANTVDTSSFFSEMLRASNASFNKDVVKGAKNKLYIESLDKVLDRHIKAMSLYANLATIIDDYNTLYNLDVSENPNDPESIASESANSEWNKSVDRQVGDRVRDEANEYFKKLISDIQGISPVKGDGNKFVGSIRRNYARYQLGANLKVLFTQTTSFAAAGSILDYDCLLKGFSISGKDVDEYCSLAKLRNSENTVAKAQGVLDHTENLGDVLLKPVGKTDRIIVRKLFAACQAQIEKDKKLTVGTEENKRAAGELLKRVILETQQNLLATERSAAMRSGNELVKTLTMFSADSMKSIGRLIDGIGRYSVLKKKLNLATDSSEKAKLNFELKEAGKQARKAMTSILTTAIQMGLIALFFRWLRGKLDKEEDAGTIILSTVIDSASNLLGGLPIYKDIASYLIDGYELENYAYSAINDILSTYKNLFDTAPKVFSGEADTQDVWSGIRNITFSTGQLFGIPSRNIYNSIRSIVGIASPSAAYNMDNMLYNKNYSSDLAKAIENEDEDMISTIAGLMLNENVGGIDSEAARTELDRLVTKGFDVIPRGVSDSFTYDGETYELNAREKKAFSRIYTVANEALGDMVKLSAYKEADDEVKAKAIKFIYDTYRSLAIQDFLDEDIESKTVLMAEAIDIEKLALIVATARSLTADTDKQGKAISGSRKQKVLSYINSLKLTAAQKFMISGFLGYRNIHGEDKVKAYINTLKLTKQEKSRLLEYSGYSAI